MIKLINKRNDKVVTTVAAKDLNVAKGDLIVIDGRTYSVSNRKVGLTTEGCSEDYSKVTEDITIYVSPYNSLH